MLGHCVIINNVATEYPGSKKDVQTIKNIYEMMRFKVTIHEDCNDKVIFQRVIDKNFIVKRLVFHFLWASKKNLL